MAQHQELGREWGCAQLPAVQGLQDVVLHLGAIGCCVWAAPIDCVWGAAIGHVGAVVMDLYGV